MIMDTITVFGKELDWVAEYVDGTRLHKFENGVEQVILVGQVSSQQVH